jgi:hypothetical protein
VFREYVEAGWRLCAIDRAQKGPTYKGWQRNPIDVEVADGIDGAGLLHAYSGTCALDIDNLPIARDWLAERGVDVDALLEAPDSVRIHSGRPGRAKLLYRLKAPLRTFKPEGSGVELRCATGNGTSVQDVLPPSVHPVTRKPYEWVYGEPLMGDWHKLPPIPATLKTLWKGLLAENPEAPTQEREQGGSPELDKLQRWIDGQNPNAEYDDWIKVGMKLHDATGGAEEGLAMWDAWSAGATRNQHQKSLPAYVKGGCRVHWLSFSSPKGKKVATLDKELPAESDEFEVEEPDETVTQTPEETKAKESKKQKRKDAIAKLEQRLVYVVASEKYFDTERHRVIGSDNALEHMFTSMMPLGSNGRLNPAKVLKSSPSKQVVEGLGFHPGEKVVFTLPNGDRYANNYRNRLPKPLEPTKLEVEKIDWIFGRVHDDTYRHWIKQLYAHAVQKPGVKIKSAPLIWSDTQRNGKSTIIKTIPALIVGAEYSQDVDYPLLTSDFNDYLQNAWHVNLAEFRAGTRGERSMIANKLKNYIADDTVPLHPKGGKGYTLPNHFFVTASSNDEDAAAIDNHDERWGIYEFKHPKYSDSERKWIIYDFLLQPRAAAVLRWYFLNYSLKGFEPGGSAPMTDAKAEMADASRSSDVELLHTLWEERAEMFAKDVVLTSEVAAYVHRHCAAKPSIARIGKLLTKAPFHGRAKQFGVGASRYRGVLLRNLELWSTAAGGDILSHIRGEDDDIDMMS